MRLSVTEIEDITSGSRLIPANPVDREVEGVCWDSRKISEGDLYVAFVGERADGHDFCGRALRAGATCALVEHALESDAIDAARVGGAGIIRVEDTARALVDLAAAWRKRLSGKVIAITGSSGKTTTKNLVRDVLCADMSVVATLANQNNELGVPNTLLRADEDTQAVVVEMGMRGPGQIQSLCDFVKPDMALVTNVGMSHIELLGSRRDIARAKAEALGAVGEGGCVFVNASDDYARELLAFGQVRERGVEAILYDGSGADPLDYPSDACPSVFAADVETDEEGFPRFTLCTPAGRVPVHLGLRGLHNVHNAAAAAAVGCAFGLQPALIARALEGARPAEGRQNVLEAANGATVVDDAYNANPDSMRASLAMFSTMKVAGRRIAVLGEMGELGEESAAAHEQVGRLAAAARLDRLICVGERAEGIASGAESCGMAPEAISRVPDAAGACELLRGTLEAEDAVLVKASHAVGLDAVVKGLCASC